MNIKDLSVVQNLKSRLEKATSHHKALMALTQNNGGSFGLNQRAHITLGGDTYGNGAMHKLELKITESPELVRKCRKLQSDAWGEVVSIRMKLRGYGVNIDSEVAK